MAHRFQARLADADAEKSAGPALDGLGQDASFPPMFLIVPLVSAQQDGVVPYTRDAGQSEEQSCGAPAFAAPKKLEERQDARVALQDWPEQPELVKLAA